MENSDIQEWRDSAHKLIDTAEAFYLLTIQPGEKLVAMYPVRGEHDKVTFEEALAA